MKQFRRKMSVPRHKNITMILQQLTELQWRAQVFQDVLIAYKEIYDKKCEV